MKQLKLAASLFVCTALCTSSAFAHISLKGEAMPASAALYNWTGYYAGLNIGAVNHTMTITDIQAVAFNASIQQVSNPSITGGFQAGYRYQLDPTRTSGVFGVEFSANFSDASYSRQYGSPFAIYQINSENSLKNVCLLQLTGGIAADRTLLFLAAGVSWTNITGSNTNVDAIAFFHSFNVNNKALGTALGGGAEYAFNDKFSARLKLDVITPNTYSSTDDTGNSFQMASSVVQGTFAVNYKIA